MTPNYHCSYGAPQRPLIKLLKITFVTWILIHCHKNIDKKFITTDSDEKMLIIFGKSPLNHFVGGISQVIKKNFLSISYYSVSSNSSFFAQFWYQYYVGDINYLIVCTRYSFDIKTRISSLFRGIVWVSNNSKINLSMKSQSLVTKILEKLDNQKRDPISKVLRIPF